MELFDHSDGESMLVSRAKYFNIPIGGTLELLPLCNMHCRMCYIQKDKKQMEKEGRMLTCDEWLKIAEDLKESGILFLLLTGGEPLLFSEFERLYIELMHMGFVITINTNGTLIDDRYADLFCKYPCRRINITVYGKDNETYGELCGNPRGYDQVMNAFRLLKERGVAVKANYTVSPWNFNQLSDIVALVNQKDIPISCASYTFPSPSGNNLDGRLSPEDCAQCFINVAHQKNPTYPMEVLARATLDTMKMPIKNHAAGYCCGAGKNGFWINWKGELACCGMMSDVSVSLKDRTFMDAWNEIAPLFRNLPLCQECENCHKRNMCPICMAANYTETGSTSGRPRYLCEVTDAMFYKLLAFIPEKEQDEYVQLFEKGAEK